MSKQISVAKAIEKLAKAVTNEYFESPSVIHCSSVSSEGYMCCRERNHEGAHIAIVFSSIAHVWLGLGK